MGKKTLAAKRVQQGALLKPILIEDFDRSRTRNNASSMFSAMPEFGLDARPLLFRPERIRIPSIIEGMDVTRVHRDGNNITLELKFPPSVEMKVVSEEISSFIKKSADEII